MTNQTHRELESRTCRSVRAPRVRRRRGVRYRLFSERERERRFRIVGRVPLFVQLSSRVASNQSTGSRFLPEGTCDHATRQQRRRSIGDEATRRIDHAVVQRQRADRCRFRHRRRCVSVAVVDSIDVLLDDDQR
jgi:hypothetical protein